MTRSVSTLVGTVIDDRYEVIGPLGSGQHGEVLRVFDTNLEAEYALKLLGTGPTSEPWQEALMLNSLNGDYILPVRNADTALEGTRYIVTDIAAMGSIQYQIDLSPLGIPENRAVSWIRDACQGVARMHRQGFLHRDIKPANLFLESSGHCVVGDLGLACIMDSRGLGAAAGTPATGAPEVAAASQARDLRVYSAQSDVFSLGASLFWALTGTPPGPTSWDEAAAAALPELWDRAPFVSRGTRDIVKKAMSHDPSRRYEGPGELAAALGSRRKTKREWIRQGSSGVHRSHATCLLGAGGPTPIILCAVRADVGYVLQATYVKSGRKHKHSGVESTAKSLNETIRRVIRAIDR